MINFKRTGGAMAREMALDVDLDSLPGDEAKRLQSMLTAANFFEIPTAESLMARPDEYEYTITVAAGNSMHTVHVSDTNMPESLQPLVHELTELARAAT